MKKALSIITMLILSFGCFAQTETFDIATYKIPKGWVKSAKAGVVTYSTSNESKGIFCIFNVYASAASKGTVKEEFESDWKELAASRFNIKTAPETDTISDDDGREVIVGSAGFERGSLSGAALLYTFVGFGRTTDILFLTNNKIYQKDIEDFLATLKLNKTFKPSTNAAAAPKAAAPQTAAATISKPSNNLEGVWMALHLRKMYLDKEPAGSLKWITFFPNGRVINAIPDEGMNNYNSNDPNMGYYQTSGGKASLQWFKEVDPSPITFINQNQITFEELYSSDTYFRCAPVNGLKLQGTWTSYENVNDPDLNDNSKNRSMIAFNKDGSFTDYGVFTRDIFSPVPAGNGTYEISNYTLTLLYNNGTKYQTAFTGSLSLNPATNNQMISIHRLAFTKR